jgi:endo-1,4-beta-xylanase
LFQITTIMQRYAGKTYCWDVVNEALNEDGSLRNSVFYQQLGSDYIAKAMGYARAADPKAKLYYNDYNLESAGGKQNGAYNLVSNLKSRGLVDGIGFQGHLNVGQMPSGLKGTIQRFAALGIEVAFTEVDIGTKSQDFTQQAKDYATLTDACVNVQGCVGITIGGIRDNESSSWRNTEYCLLWNTNYQPKPAATSLASVAAAGTARPPTGGGSTPVTVPTTAPTTAPTTSNPNPTGCTSPKYAQCGGSGYTGCTVCASGSTCTYSNPYYSQCL